MFVSKTWFDHTSVEKHMVHFEFKEIQRSRKVIVTSGYVSSISLLVQHLQVPFLRYLVSIQDLAWMKDVE
jgi:hypothetical protein